MIKGLLLKLKESFFAVFPITAIIFLMFAFFIPVDTETIIKLSISFVLLVIGMTLFNLGADNSMIELGEGIGSNLSKSKKMWLLFVVSFLIGFIITFAEPDLKVLANQVAEFSSLDSSWLFIIMVSAGVGISMLLAVLKVIFKVKISVILTIIYVIVFGLSFFVPKEFVPIAFDSGSVTTGPISVPFLITFGLGLCAVRSGNNEDDSFGFIALCSAGPILSVMILSLFLKSTPQTIIEETTTLTMWQEFGNLTVNYIKDVALTLLPIIILFAIFQLCCFKYPKQKVYKMIIGFLFTYVGIVLFLTGVEFGYLHTGQLIGLKLGSLNDKWISVLFGGILGIFSVLAEPALHVLKKQVEDITGGAIKQKVIVIAVCIGVSLSVAVAVLQAIINFNIIYVLLPVYAVCLILGFINTKLFTAVAFDAGGVATGAMAVSFILPMTIALSSEGATGFGTVALIAIFPVLSIQILGFIFKLAVKYKQYKFIKLKNKKFEIINYDYELNY